MDKYPIGRIRFSDEIEKRGTVSLNYKTDNDGIPRKYMVHGHTKFDSDYKAKIVDYYEDYYIVKFQSTQRNSDNTGTHVQLGFLHKDLQPAERIFKEPIDDSGNFTIKIIENH